LERALENYNTAIELFRNPNDEDHPNIATVYNGQKKYTETLDFYKRSITIMEPHLPFNHPDIATSHNNIDHA